MQTFFIECKCLLETGMPYEEQYKNIINNEFDLLTAKKNISGGGIAKMWELNQKVSKL